MKKLFAITFITFISFSAISPVSAAGSYPGATGKCTAGMNAAIASNKLDLINRAVAKHPGQAGDAAACLFGQAQNNVKAYPEESVKLFTAAVPFAPQLKSEDVPGVVGSIKAIVALANEPEFQRDYRKEAGRAFSGAIAVLALPAVSDHDPHLRANVVADAGDFLGAYPDADPDLREDVSLAMGGDLNGVNPDLITIRIREHHVPPSPTFSPPSPSQPSGGSSGL